MLAPAVVYALIDAQTRLYNVVITTSDKMIAKQNAIVNAYLKIKQAAIDTIGAFIKEKEAKIEFAAQIEGLSRKDLKRYIQTREPVSYTHLTLPTILRVYNIEIY
jgi:hypothetical protein